MITTPCSPRSSEVGNIGIETLRSVARGLGILRLLNERDNQSLSDLAARSGLSRGTVYRMINSLQVKGLVERNNTLGTYILTVKVKALSHGYDQEEWTSEHARPLLLELGERINWPISLDTVMGNTVITRENTDSVSSLVFQVIKGGSRVPLLSCASGWVLLTQFSQSERVAVLEANKTSPDPHISMLAARESYVEHMLAEIISHGFCCRSKPADRETEISVPVYLKGQRRLAALSIRYFSTAMRQEKAIELYVPFMQETSQKITDCYQAKASL